MTNPSQDKSLRGAFPAMRRARKSVSKESESLDIDVSPYLNVFLALLPMMITMAVFTHLAIVEFSLPPSASAGTVTSADSTKELDISIVVSAKGFRIVGTGKQLDLVPLERGSYQFEVLRTLLKAIKFEYPSQKSVVLVLEPTVLYDDIIHFMDVCRESQFPDISLSGDIQ